MAVREGNRADQVPTGHHESAGQDTAGTDSCPGVIALAPARDGLLARIRLPGGLITTAQLRAVAELATTCGDGNVDLTSRANLQIRGVQARTAGPFAAGLRATGLLPSDTHERIRNVVASPLSGVDPEELLDARPLVGALDAALQADPALAALPAKFGFTIDGGGVPVCGAGEDVGLVAVAVQQPSGTTAAQFALALGGRDTGWRLAPRAAVRVALAAGRAFLTARAAAAPDARRLRDLTRDTAGLATVLAALEERVAGLIDRSDTPLVRRRAPAVGPLGVLPQKQAGRVALAPVVPLARLSAIQVHGLADLATALGADVRITPWRGIVLANVPAMALEAATEALRALGLSLSPRDPYAGLVACAGLHGCAAALADVRADAAALATRLAGQVDRPRLIYLSGCSKRCAMRGTSDVLLVGMPNGYELTVGGVVTATGLQAATAVSAAASALLGTAASTSEVSR